MLIIHCINAGINLVNVAIICVRGNIQDAVKQVYAITGISLQIRFCTLHTLCNIKQNFGCSGSDFENSVRKVQSAESEIDYNASLEMRLPHTLVILIPCIGLCL